MCRILVQRWWLGKRKLVDSTFQSRSQTQSMACWSGGRTKCTPGHLRPREVLGSSPDCTETRPTLQRSRWVRGRWQLARVVSILSSMIPECIEAAHHRAPSVFLVRKMQSEWCRGQSSLRCREKLAAPKAWWPLTEHSSFPCEYEIPPHAYHHDLG